MPARPADVPEGVTRTFWLTVKVPAERRGPALTGARSASKAERGGELALPLRFTVRKGTLDPVDIPAGPVRPHDRPALVRGRGRRLEPRRWRSKSLRKLRAVRLHDRRAACPSITYRGFEDGASPDSTSPRRRPDELASRSTASGMPVVTYCGASGAEHLLQGRGRDEGGGLPRLPRVPEGDLRGGAEARRRGGLAPGLLEHRRRAARRRPDPRRRERRGLPPGVPARAALLHRGQLVHGDGRAATRTSACRGPCTSSTWNIHDERRRRTCCTRPAATGPSTTAATAGPTATTCTRPRSLQSAPSCPSVPNPH